MNEIAGTRVLVLGYGREGKSTERFLRTHYPTLILAHADQKDGEKYLAHINDYDTVIRSPGVPGSLQELIDYKKRGGWVTSATNIFFSLCPGVTIGVTGTKGKSTTASLIAHILRAQGAALPDVRLVGNIGRPMLDYLDGSTRDTLFIIELSSHQLEDIRYSPHIAVILAIVPEHLDYYKDFSAYERAKSNIVRFQKKDDLVFYHPSIEKIARLSTGRKIPIVSVTHRSPLLGNQTNISAAVSVAKYFGLSERAIQKSLETFTPLPHRLEYVGEFKKIRFYNDSLATIPEATIHALEALGSDVKTLIAGGFDRGLDFKILGEYLVKTHIKTLILFPDTGRKIWEAVSKAHPSRLSLLAYHYVSTMEEAVELAYKYTPEGTICLLSPASASFNLFRDYEDRGNQFKEWVKKLGDQ